MQFQELSSEGEWARAWPVLVHLRKSLNREEFLRRRDGLQEQGFLLFGLSEGEQLGHAQ